MSQSTPTEGDSGYQTMTSINWFLQKEKINTDVVHLDLITLGMLKPTLP